MNKRRFVMLGLAAIASWPMVSSIATAQAPAPAADPLIKENTTVKISPHAYVIPDGGVGLVPNVGIIVGTKATLVVDTGMGPRNGQTIVREVAKVSKNADLYVVSTHYSPDHAGGEPGFPASAKVIRARAQQKDIDEFGQEDMKSFGARTPVTAELLKNAVYRRADELFDREKVLDLGGVHARIFWMANTHTRGETVTFIEEDRVLFSSNVTMQDRFLSLSSPYSSVRDWLTSLDQLDPLHPSKIVPAHGPLGDASMIKKDRAYLKDVQARVHTLKAQGKSSDEAAKMVTAELRAKYAEWTGAQGIAVAAKSAYVEDK